jgi:ATP-dependent RNA helicase DBP3
MHIYNKRAQNKQSSGTMVLVLSPTRELAIQIQEQIIKFGEALKLSSICLYGGVSKGDQIRQLKQWNHQPDVIVATPGRLLDLMNDGHVRLSSVDFFVLDEADRMLDLGFEPDIRRIVAELPKERQTVMFSATWPVSIQQLSQKYLNNPIKITVGSQDLSANVNITQHVEVMEPHAKDGRLLQLLKQIHNRKNRILIFALYKKEAERLEQFVLNKGFKAAGIHGNLNQHQRTQAIQSFRDGSTPLLIATDVAVSLTL